ncbi:hypothetical protein MUK42_27056 [Musa troglodytarum]|uniref:Uncharacterized protein n=1 Tax=Musa troglodytarum TaxID=320322 RepID=A0A9E7KA94_9LILI|nr:hypothetical protein MUK42_27056 [Musa troglodytarum]
MSICTHWVTREPTQDFEDPTLLSIFPRDVTVGARSSCFIFLLSPGSSHGLNPIYSHLQELIALRYVSMGVIEEERQQQKLVG